jgi:ATP-dependent helicase HrpB
MSAFDPPLPIDRALPDLLGALREGSSAVLIAPPGAGKTTRVPLVLAAEPWAAEKKILLLEPRRLAARAAAARMAATLQERVGDTLGLRLRFGSKLSRRTRIEVVTEGVFTRLILEDPSLEGIAAVLFDEFHERSLDADLGLALAIEVQRELREDLKLLVMSATLDGGRVAELLGGASRIESRGRAFPVDTRYLGRDARQKIEPQMAEAIAAALRTEHGSVLAFLPGAGEIRRAEALLATHVRDPAVTSSRSTARSTRTCRTGRSRRHRRAAAKSCWRLQSPKARSRSRACASSWTAGSPGSRATSPASGSRAW